MNKQLLSIVSLVALAVTQSSIRLVAAPPDGAASTAESDRKFLSNLENKEAAQSAPAESAPQPQVVPAPVQPAAPATQSPAKNATRSVATAPRTEPRSEPTETRITPTATVRREIVEEQSQTSDVRTNDGPGASARIYKSRPEGSVKPTNSKSASRRARNVAEEEEGTHIVQPAEIAQYGVAPTVPTKTTKVTTTYVQQPTAVIRKEDRNEDHDESHVNDHSFFHRLFHGGIFKKHGED
jgi:hypothetical protein